MVKNMNLRIRRDGSIYVSANEFISDKEVDRFVGDKAAFIANAQDKFKKAAQREQRPEQYISGDVLCSKSFTPSVAGWMSTNPLLLPVLLLPMTTA